MSVLSWGLCLPQRTDDQAPGFDDCGLNPAILPPLVRRRTSLATRMAVTAADRACTGMSRDLPAIFVSAVGEMQVTHRLCEAIARKNFPLSPTLFHNSVHNTAAGYWSIAVDTMEPMQAMAALDDGFALGLIEAGCQIAAGTPQLLLVCYDEHMPEALLPKYTWQPCALALVLGVARDDYPQLSMPYRVEAPENTAAPDFGACNPTLQGLPLLEQLQNGTTGKRRVQLTSGTMPWFTDLVLP